MLATIVVPLVLILYCVAIVVVMKKIANRSAAERSERKTHG
jgi:branched-subunit amino acid permease